MVRSLLAWVLVTSALVLAPSTTAAHAGEPLRVLVVGDSVTQGSVGDWTWRYRLWKQFEASGVPVDFVGPRDDLWDLEADDGGSHAYLDPSFDQDHAAKWGMQLGRMPVPIGDLVATYRPDVVVEALGVNDLGFGELSPTEVLDLARGFVADARAADPDVDVVLGAVPQRWVAGAVDYDAALPGLAAELDSDPSRVTATDVGAGFTEEDTWDGGHPSATGEMKVAVSVAAALSRIGVPVAFPEPAPTVENGPPVGAVLELTGTTRHGVSLRWTPPLGATSERVWIRDLTEGPDWFRGVFEEEGTSWSSGYLDDGHHYQFRLQAAKGTAVAEHVFSNVVDAWPAPPAPSPVTDLVLTPVDHGLTAGWSAADAATRYRVRWWPVDAPEETAQTETVDTTAAVTGLRAGRRYAVSVEPLDDWVPGPPTVATGIAGGPVPVAPGGLRVVLDKRHRGAISWAADGLATSYVLTLDGGVPVTTTQTRWRSPALPVGRHIVAVRAWAEDVPGPAARLRFRVR
ncbi:MAG: fibronectin type III domain-containing protein [Nocardioides sp.]|nr:fibronectin type III domain-containing protein [Nocardioidaceae bacterium]MCB8956063.1 fibronectin type III domain-containing protein [Nocardioides sp.]